MATESAGRRVTSTDVARLSGVSRATVSYVLNDDRRQTISAETRERVRDAAASLGYVPDARASALRRGRSRLVLLSLDPLNSGHVGEMITAGVTDRLRKEGYVVVAHTDERPDALLEIVAEIAPVAVISLRFMTADIRRSLQRAGVRRILDLETVEGAEGPPDRPWEFPIGQLQVDHLATRGYDRLIYALPERSYRMPIALARLAGARMECTVLGIDQPQVIELPLDRTTIARRLQRLDRVPDRTAICAYEDQIAIGVLGAMQDLGWVVGRDLAVIGCDDLPIASLVTPPLTSVTADASGVGFAAAEAFLMLEDGEIRSNWTPEDIDYAVVERLST